jgi:hypothetical protein
MFYSIIVGWALPSTKEPWGATLGLSADQIDVSEALEILPMAHVCQAWRVAVQPE